jgi:fibronectin-binding autotransporter adhesin
MAQQTIGIGSSANDGTGDPLRTAFTKINTNFSELYGDTAEANDLLEDASPQLGGNLDINGWNIVSARTNEDIVLVPSGTGGVIASGIRLAGTTISADDSSTVNINEGLNVDGAATIEGAATLSSTLAVTGATTLTTTTIDNLTIADNNISSGSNADINITPGGTGDVVLGALRVNGTTLNSSDSTKVTIAEALDITGTTTLVAVTATGTSTLAAMTATTGSFSSTLAVTGVSTLSGSVVLDNITINQSTISSASNADINITPGGTGNVVVHGLTFNGTSIASADSTTVNINDILNVDGNATIEGTLTTADITTVGTQTITGTLNADYIQLKDNVITTNATNAILNVGASGSGTVNVFNAMTTIGQTVTGTMSVTGQLNADNLRLDGNVLSATTGGITLTPAAGSTVALGGVATATELHATLGEFVTLRCDALQSDTSNGNITITAQGTGIVAIAPQVTLTGSLKQAIHTFVATDAITEVEHAGRTLLLGEVGGNALVTLTLPDATGSGATYKFIVTVTNTSTYVIKAPDSSNTIDGIMLYLDEDGTAVTGYPTVAASDTITLNSGTTGGQIGDYLELIDIAADQWHVRGVMRCLTGVDPATPFSATV